MFMTIFGWQAHEPEPEGAFVPSRRFRFFSFFVIE